MEFSEYGDEPLGSIERGFLDLLLSIQPLKKNPVP
jgi:hypothetical protein